jgi:hypothetical protein
MSTVDRWFVLLYWVSRLLIRAAHQHAESLLMCMFPKQRLSPMAITLSDGLHNGVMRTVRSKQKFKCPA